MLLLKYQWQEITEKFAMRRHNLYHEDSNWWEEESKDESTDSVAIALSHPGSAAKSLFSEIMQTSYDCTDVSTLDSYKRLS